MGIRAGWLMLAVIALRLVLRGAPKWVRRVLWAFVALRLVCPFSVQSIFSLMPEAQAPALADAASDGFTDSHSGISAARSTGISAIREPSLPGHAAGQNPLRTWTSAAGILWLAGLLLFIGYALFSLMRLRRSISEAVHGNGSGRYLRLTRHVQMAKGKKGAYKLWQKFN